MRLHEAVRGRKPAYWLDQAPGVRCILLSASQYVLLCGPSTRAPTYACFTRAPSRPQWDLSSLSTGDSKLAP